MTGQEIKTQIATLNKQIMEMTYNNHFILNAAVSKIYNDITELQKQCPHDFEEGKCIYCGKENK